MREPSEHQQDMAALARVDDICELLEPALREKWAEVKAGLLATGRLTPSEYRDIVQHLAKHRINLRFPG